MEEAPSTELLLLESRAAEEDSEYLQSLSAAYKTALYLHESPHTRRAYAKDINQFILWFQDFHGGTIREILFGLPQIVKRHHTIAYRDWLRKVAGAHGKPLSDSSLNRKLSTMAAVFRELQNAALCTGNPFRGLAAGYKCDPTPALSNEERQRLISAPDFENVPTVKERRKRLRDRCLLIVLFVHGLRRDEARRIRYEDIATNQGYFVVNVRQKGGTTIAHRLHPKLYHYLQIYRAEFMKDDGYIFTGLARNGNSKENEPMSSQAVYDTVLYWGRRAGLSAKATPHVGRATVITEALKKAPLQTVSRAVAHRSVQSTLRYDRTRNRMDQAVMTFQDCEL